jgi:diaminohydroxyphosphoribosylaminopyrimidine deaminase/5-amino-6-(5-phosphoribosylamino)uracil reductase
MAHRTMDLEPLMRRALELAERGGGGTSPNPMVGCVIVDGDGRVIGEGYHKHAGSPHAEVEALEVARSKGREVDGAMAVVTLEPCAHTGRTPPCAAQLIESRIGRVVYAAEDPHVGAGGESILNDAGVAVEKGLLEVTARRLNEAWYHFIRSGRPFFHLKTAQTLSGHVTRGVGEERWVTGEDSRRTVHRLRRCHRAVLVGVGTALADDPLLTVRDWPPPRADRGWGIEPEWPDVQPVRVVVDTALRLPLTSRLVKSASKVPLLVFCGPHADAESEARLVRAGVEIERVPVTSGSLDLAKVSEALGERGVTGVLVEAGPGLTRGLFEAGMIDRWTVFLASDWVQATDAVRCFPGSGWQAGIRLAEPAWERHGDDLSVTGIPVADPQGRG